MILWEWVRGENRGVLTEWRRKLEREGVEGMSLSLLDNALDQLEEVEHEALPRLIAGTWPRYPEIRKLQLGGKVRLRPLLCIGPASKRTELTFLMPAYERNGRFDPRDAPEQADRRRKLLISDLGRRRLYER
jgi:hypothetical protein